MTDRTMLAIGRTTISVPKLTKRALQAALAVVLTAIVSLVIVVLNNALTAKGGWSQGLDVWFGFIRRSDILGTMALTAIVSVLSVYWQTGASRK